MHAHMHMYMYVFICVPVVHQPAIHKDQNASV